LIATHSGLRGRPGLDITDALVSRVVRGLVEHLRQEELPTTVGLARDERPAGEPLAALVSATVTASGSDVVDFGVVSTPAAKLAARRRGLGGVVVVTGSHLAPHLTGLKLVTAPIYGPLDSRRLALPEDGASAVRRRGRVLHDQAAAAEHAAAVLAAVDADAIRDAGLRVRIGGGAGCAGALLLERLGGPPPGSRLDLALQLDPDGDRLRLLDERGRELDEEVTFPLTALALDARNAVKGADTSRMIDDLTAARGADVRVVSPGELHLVKELTEAGGDIAGEGNGGVVVPAVGLARDGLAAGAAVMELLARTGSSLSELAGRLPRYVRRRSTVPCADRRRACAAIEAVAARVEERAADAGGGGERDPEQGLLVERDGAWGLVRQSATEPVLRLTVEARSQAAVDDLHAELQAALGEAAAT
jgi:phosphomannomutase